MPALTDANYVDDQIPDSATQSVADLLELCVLLLEERAARQHGRKLPPGFDVLSSPTCSICGHVSCQEHK